MNWTNYRLLVDDLRQLTPERFNYGSSSNAQCGCVAVQIFKRCEPNHGYSRGCSYRTIQYFLGIDVDEAKYIYGDRVIELDGSSNRLFDGYGNGPSGTAGIAEALRRLSVVAARYGGEPQQPDPTPVPTDAQTSRFLASVRSLIDQPLVETE